jgi:hypothetical protein
MQTLFSFHRLIRNRRRLVHLQSSSSKKRVVTYFLLFFENLVVDCYLRISYLIIVMWNCCYLR